MNIDDFQIEELVRGIGELDDEADIDQYLFDNFEIGFDQFQKIVEVLLPLTAVGQSPLTQKIYKGFARDGMFLIKTEDSQ